MSKAEIQRIVDQIIYKDWWFMIKIDGHRLYLQLYFDGWFSRKWFLSPHMCESEIIQTALKAVLTAEEHEAREHFLFLGKPIFGPHINVNKLWEVCDVLETRDPPQG